MSHMTLGRVTFPKSQVHLYGASCCLATSWSSLEGHLRGVAALLPIQALGGIRVRKSLGLSKLLVDLETEASTVRAVGLHSYRSSPEVLALDLKGWTTLAFSS